MNIINGGAHADNGVDFQEFMVLPIGAETFSEALRWGAEIYHALKSCSSRRASRPAVGDEGGFAPDLESTEAALDLIVEAIERPATPAGVAIALDPAPRASSSRTARTTSRASSSLEPTELIAYYAELVANVPARLDRGRRSPKTTGTAGSPLTDELGDKVQLVGDDLFVTNTERLADGHRARASRTRSSSR